MKRFITSLLSKTIIAFVMNVANPLITALVSRVKTGEWFSYIDSAYYIITSALLAVWLVSSLVYRKVHVMRVRNSIPFGVISVPTFGWIKLGELTYEGVVWIIQIPKTLGEKPDLDDIEAKSTARCPKCKTELDETVTFFGRYKWICHNCGFKKSSKISMFVCSERATRIAKRKVEEGQEKNEQLSKV